MTLRRRILLEWSVLSALLCALSVACALQGWLWRLDLQLHDIALSRQALRADPAIVIIAIDDASLAQLGRWPWPRKVHAALLERLQRAGVRAVALDIIFSEAGADDALLASALKNLGKTVLPVLQRENNERIDGESLPTPALQQAASALGHIQMELDPDGIARSVYLYAGWQAARHPQLALALHQLDTAQAPGQTSNPGPGWRRSNWLRIPFAGPPGSFTRLSYADVLAGRIAPELLRDKLVLVGATSPGLADAVPVPMSGLSRPMPGVEVHANILAALRSGHTLTLASPWLNAALALAASLALMLLLARTQARSGLLWTLALSAALLTLSWLGLVYFKLWLAPASALLACLLAYPLWSWRRLEATQRFIDAELELLHQDKLLSVPENLDPLQQRLARLQAAARLGRDARALVESVIAHLPLGVIALHTDGRVRIANPAARELLGLGSTDDIPSALRALPWPANLPLTKGLPSIPAEVCEIRLHNRAEGPLMLRLAPLDPHSLIIALADLSQIEAAQQAREDTLRFVTHDLRAPLASVISLIDVAPPEVELLPAIRQIADKALELIDELFRLSRAEAADPESFQLLDLHGVILDACELCWAQARSSRVEILRPAMSEQEALVRGDADLLHRALGNLISNAIKYGGEDRQIELSLQPEGAFWCLAVRDHGPGVPERDRLRLFQRFSRLPDAIRRGLPGSGLGLLMVRSVAERHGGRVEADFPPDGGSRFSLLLPRSGD